MKPVSRVTLPLLVISSLAVIVGVQYWGYERPPLGIDDANIYFVYMKNFANGLGFVWNPGDEKVEGFTSLLWTLIGAGVYKLSPTHFAGILATILFILIAFTLTITLNFLRRLNKTDKIITYFDLIVLSLLLLPLGFADWNILSLMETGLWTSLITTTMILLTNSYLGDRRANPLLFILLIIAIDLTRPESILFSVLFSAFFFIANRSHVSWKKSLMLSLVPLLAHIGTTISIISWRLQYFGFAFPNTYYAKVSSSLGDNIKAGINYAFVFFYNYPVNAFILVMLFFFTGKILLKFKAERQINSEEKVHLALTMFILIVLAMPMITGGDHFKYNRFYQMMLPLFFASICNKYVWNEHIKIKLLSGRVERIALLTASFAMIVLSAKYTIFDFVASQRRILHYPVIQDFIVSKQGREVADEMNKTFLELKQYPSVGTLATGGFAFIYKGKTIDLMGLNNVRMAHANSYKVGYRNHASFDKKVFYQLMPDMMGTFYGAEIIADTTGFVLPENKPEYRTDYANMVYGSYKQIFDDVEFRNAYQPALLHKAGNAKFIFDYCSNEFLKKIDTTKISVTLLKRNALSDQFVKQETLQAGF